jgi:CHRD domain-containing protein
VAMLVGAGAAVASHRAQSTQQAAATFAAASVSQSRSSTCQSADGIYQDTTATYTGTATSSDSRLNGPVTIRVRSILNTTTQFGWLSGSLRTQSTNANIDGALAGGQVIGFLRGNGHHSEGQLRASFSAAFTPGGGFSSGQLGTGSATNAGVFFTSGSCSRVKRFSSTAVFRVSLNPNEVVPPVSGLHANANGSVTFDLSHDTSGAITGGNAVFYLNYRFPGSVSLTGLTLHQGNRGSNGTTVLDASIGTVNDSDGGGNVTKVVTGVSAAVLQAVLGNPHGYYLTLTTAANPNGALRDQLENPTKH